MTVRVAGRDDVAAMVELAARQRAAYAEHAHPFQRPAANAAAMHGPFLEGLVTADDVLVLVHDAGAVDGFIVAQIGGAPPPFRAEGRRDCHVDDFAVANAELWETVGRTLLGRVTAEAERRGADRLIVVVGPHDVSKRRLLRSVGLDVTAEWWTKALPSSVGQTDRGAAAAPPDGVQATVVSAPPVYDPGGPVALHIQLDAGAVRAGEQWATDAGAAVAVVPVRVTNRPLRQALEQAGFVVASEWLSRDLAASLESTKPAVAGLLVDADERT